MATKYQSNNPLKDAMAKITADNLARITALRVAKSFTNIGEPFVGFEGKDKKGDYFQLRVDYDPDKKGHVNVMVNGSERHEYMGESYTWFEQVVNNINGGSYCDVPKNSQNMWLTDGMQTDSRCIEGMKKFMRKHV
jgi:hypothetical protein